MHANRKIFCIGAHKTGTTSLMEALSLLGFRCCPEQRWYDNPSYQHAFYSGDYREVFELIRDFDVFQDSPFNHSTFFADLYHEFPDALFILTIRDADELIASHRRWIAILESNAFLGNQGLKATIDEFWRREFGQEAVIGNADSIKKIYRARNDSVVEFFGTRAEQLLVLDLVHESNPWRELCAFVNRPIPYTAAFPHANRTK